MSEEKEQPGERYTQGGPNDDFIKVFIVDEENGGFREAGVALHKSVFGHLKPIKKRSLWEVDPSFKKAFELERDGFAVRFADWISRNNWETSDIVGVWENVIDPYLSSAKTTIELIELYKLSIITDNE